MSLQRILSPPSAFRVEPGLCALGIMTKAPEAGRVKTRLTPPLTNEEAAQLNICFLRDIAAAIREASTRSAASGVGVYTPVGREAAYENVLPGDFFLLPQRGETFGERLFLAAQDLFRVGFESVCLINSDSPTVPASSFAKAAKELARPGDRVVIGPSEDGGYYLIGLKKRHRRLFEEIAWSTAAVFQQTMQRARALRLETVQLPHGFDVDDRATLVRLCHELLGDSVRSTTGLAPNTGTFLKQIIEREGRDRIWPKKM